jgi:aminopeptidase N
MSSYLLHLTIGDLERVSRKVAGVDVGVVTRKGATAMADFALESAARILPWYHDYFDTPYPLPKLDMIAAPGESQFFGAMENWGAILYFEHVLLIDPARSSESDRQGVFEVVAHEVAHQWFGNLVTMRWWDDLWLNEGFASWMASRITDALHPEWQPWLQLVGGSRETAMQLDAGAATHAIVQPVNSIAAINQAFDAIAYSKGEAVIRMLEEAVGVAGFRDGIRRYMRRHAYGNAVTDDLWRAVEEATGKPVTGIAHGFTRQPGVPLVTAGEASCRAGTTSIALAQSRFETDERSARQHSWHIPVRLQAIGSTARTETLMTPGEPVQLSLAGCGPLLVNSGQAGYFRTLYPPEEVVRLRDAFARIPGVDQLGLLSDAWALGQTGTIPVSNYLDFASVVQPDADPLVWRDIARQFALIDRMLDGSPEQAAWRGIARSRLRPQFDRVGWTRQPGQTDSVALLRESLITSLGALHDSSLLAQARSRFLRAPQDPAALPAGIRLSVLDVTARHADEETWQEILSRARAEKEPIERHRLYSRLGLALDPVLARHALDLALSGEPPATVAPSIIKTVADQHPALAFEFATANESAVQRLVEAGSRWSFIPLLARTSADLDLVRQLRAYVAKTLAEDARKDANEVVAEIERRARTRAMARPQVEAWIRDQTSRD